MTIREAYERLLGRRLPDTVGDNPNVSIRCFHHDDAHNSCSVDVDTGLWFCHATGVGGGLVQAASMVLGVDLATAKTTLGEWGVVEGAIAPRRREEKPPIDAVIRDKYVKDLFDDQVKLKWITRRLGWADSTVRRFRVGVDRKSGRLTIPVHDADGRLRNFRMYDADSQGVDKMISWSSGYGTARLFPVDELTDEIQTVVLCEGEKDCVLMNQVLSDQGLTDWLAMTGTGGAATWRDAWTPLFADRDVIVVYDIDRDGVRHGTDVASKLTRVARSVKSVRLDITQPTNADVTDYFVSSGKGWDDFKGLLERTPYFTSQTKRDRPERDRDVRVYSPHLSEASSEKFLHKSLSLSVVLAGKDLAPFAVPAKVEYDCDIDLGPPCAGCALSQSNGVATHQISPDDPDVIHFVKVTDRERDTLLRRRAGVYPRCPKVKSEITEFHNVEETTVVPEIDFSDEDREYVSRTAYVMGHGVVPNQTYTIDGTALPHPKTQHVVHHVTKIRKSRDSLDSFRLTNDVAAALHAFRPGPGQSIWDKVDEIARDLETNVTKIYGRRDIVMGVDLCYHTVVSFKFMGRPVGKAWGDILIVGDTRTGKTETVQEMLRHYRMGELVVGENASFAGLVGGLRQEAGKRWSITWGKIPLNDRRLLVIDETSGISRETIGTMSGIRSNGVAEIDKIMTQRTTARTRLIFISNPRSNKSMADHGYGIDAVKELIGRPEDIARFDFVMAAATNEVPIELINAPDHGEVPHVYTSDLCRTLLLWAWSRTADEVEFTEEAVRRVLEVATEHSRRYASDAGVPLVEGGNHRIKVAKLAVSVAVRTFSTTTDYSSVLVTPEHVDFVDRFLTETYAKPSLDYAGWSETVIARKHVPKELQDDTSSWCDRHPQWASMWLIYDSLRPDDFRTQFDMEAKDVREHIFKPLSQMGMIAKAATGSGYVKTPVFITVLKDAKDRNGGLSLHGHRNGHDVSRDMDTDVDHDIPF